MPRSKMPKKEAWGRIINEEKERTNILDKYFPNDISNIISGMAGKQMTEWQRLERDADRWFVSGGSTFGW